eukprot:s1870_g10.t1
MRFWQVHPQDICDALLLQLSFRLFFATERALAQEAADGLAQSAGIAGGGDQLKARTDTGDGGHHQLAIYCDLVATMPYLPWPRLLVLLLLTPAVAATDVSRDRCQNDSAELLQVAFLPETFSFKEAVRSEETLAASDGPIGPFGPKHPNLKGVMLTSIEWYSSRDLARVGKLQNITISSGTVQIFSAVPVFGEESYIALLVEQEGDAWKGKSRDWWPQLDAFVMFCAGPDGSHKTQVEPRGHSWVCPWPREEWRSKQFQVFLEDKDGQKLGTVVAEHEPELLGQYTTMACVRDIFYTPSPKNKVQSGLFSGPFKQWIEWMEWSSMHGLEHFLIYTFEGTDLAAKDLMKPYLDAGIASRVHFQSFHRSNLVRFGRLMNDCIYRAKNHAKWLATSVDVDEYMVFPGRVKYFKWDHILKEQGVSEDKVASLELARVRFARARPETFEISSDHRVPTLDERPKQVINVDNVYRTSIHWLTCSKNGTEMIHVDSKLAMINHYRIPEAMWTVDYEHFNFQDPYATMADEGLRKEMPLLETALAKRFNIQTSDVKDFLKNLARRHPPATNVAAAHHNMW